jgi:hypothetical protein
MNGIDTIGGNAKLVSIRSEITTRQYNLQTAGRKRWNEFELQIQSHGNLASNGSILFELENLDANVSAGRISDFNGGYSIPAGEDISIRGRIGNKRAYGIKANLVMTEGKPIIRVVRLTGGASFRSTLEAI